MTTAINILATFRLVFNWLSRLRLAEFMVVTPPLLGSFSLLRLTNLMVVLQVLQQKERKKIHQMDMISFFFFPPSHVSRKKGPLSMFPIMVWARVIWSLFIFLFLSASIVSRFYISDFFRLFILSKLSTLSSMYKLSV